MKLILKYFYQLLNIYELFNDRYRVKAYRSAIYNINNDNINKIGERLRMKIKSPQIAKEEIDVLKKYIPLMKIKGFGPAYIKKLIKQDIIINRPMDLIKKHKLKLTRIQKLGLKYYKDMKPLNRSQASTIIDEIQNILINCKIKLVKYKVAGSFRRQKTKINDIDIIIVANSKMKKIYNCISENYHRYIDYYALGKTKYSFLLNYNKNIVQIDIRLVDIKSFYTTLFYFTGSSNFGVMMRSKFKKIGYKLNEYRICDSNNNVYAIESEKDIFDLLDMKYIKPKYRK